MIFDPSLINQPKFKAQFIELITVYIRLVEVFAEKHNYAIPTTSLTSQVEEELLTMGVLTADFTAKDLQKILGSIV